MGILAVVVVSVACGVALHAMAPSRGMPNMWTTGSGDEALGLVYLPLGVSAVNYWSGSLSDPENSSPPRWSRSTSILANPSGISRRSQRCLGLRSRLAGGRQFRSGIGAAEQEGRYLRARSPDRQTTRRRQGAPGSTRRCRARCHLPALLVQI
jgi:hypothetical protein